MDPKNDAETLMRRYLLGELAEAEQRRVEELYFGDDDQFELVSIVEEDLVDDYVSGSLTREERASFERNYLTSHERRQHVDFAQHLLVKARSRKLALIGRWRLGLIAAALGAPLSVPRWAGAIAMVFLMAGILWTVHLSRKADHAELRLEQEIARKRDATPRIFSPGVLHGYGEDGPVTGAAPEPITNAAPVHRDDEFAIPSTAQMVELVLSIPSDANDPCAHGVTGELWRLGTKRQFLWLTSALCSKPDVARLYVPAQLLTAGEFYSVTLSAEGRARSHYSFSVSSR